MNKVSSYKPSSGWARPEYINRHPQPPAKYIGFYEISQITKCYKNYFKIHVDSCRDLGYTGINKGEINETINHVQ